MLIPEGFSYQCREKHLNDVSWDKLPEYACDAADTMNGSGPDCGTWVFQQILSTVQTINWSRLVNIHVYL